MARFASDWNRQASNKEWMSEPALTTLRVPRAKPLETSPTTPRRAIDPTTDWVDEWVPAELGQAARNFSKNSKKRAWTNHFHEFSQYPAKACTRGPANIKPFKVQLHIAPRPRGPTERRDLSFEHVLASLRVEHVWHSQWDSEWRCDLQ